MKYVILIHSNPESRAMWESFSADEQAAGFDFYGDIVEELRASGELIVTEALGDVSLARRVTVQDGRTTTADGPFAEVKEMLAGFFLIDCESEARAIEVAARLPEAELGLIEVRPVMEVGASEM